MTSDLPGVGLLQEATPLSALEAWRQVLSSLVELKTMSVISDDYSVTNDVV